MTVVNQKHFLEPATEKAIDRIKGILSRFEITDKHICHEMIVKELCANPVPLDYTQIEIAESQLIDFVLAQEEERRV